MESELLELIPKGGPFRI